jgi:hypothetical protein
MNRKFLILILSLLLFSCKKEMKFDVNKWNDFEDNSTFEYRDAMLNDLLKNYHLKGRNISDMEKIFGPIDEHNFSDEKNLLIFEVLQKWCGIDPIYTKYLNLEFNQSGIIDSVYVTEYKRK